MKLTTNEQNWKALNPDEVFELFQDLTIPWWIAGGWAIGLLLGKFVLNIFNNCNESKFMF